MVKRGGKQGDLRSGGLALHLSERLVIRRQLVSRHRLSVESTGTSQEEIMPTDTVEELRKFHRFLTDKLSADGIDLSPEEALDEWRRVHPQPQAFDEDVAAIREALDDMAAGDRGIPFDEFDREFRKRHSAL
jgi:hypothetical protein